jgi:hypothetical protein
MTSIKKIDQLRLLKGLSIPMTDGACFVKHLTIGEIAEIGLEEFYQYLNLFTVEDDEINIKIDDKSIDLYNALMINCRNDFNIRNKIEVGLCVFTGEQHCYYDEERDILFIDNVDDRRITEENFNEFRSILQIIYRIKKEIEDQSTMTEAERKMRKKFEDRKKQLAKAKQKEGRGDKITLEDLIIGLMVVGRKTNEDVWNFPFYSFYEAFYCLERKEQYEVNLKSLLAGADPKKVKLIHWLDKTEELKQ